MSERMVVDPVSGSTAGGRLLLVHSHVELLAGRKASGQPVLEQVPAEPVGDDQHRLLGTPVLALGCAQGDIVTVAGDGSFDVVSRGGNLSVLVYGEALTGAACALVRTLAPIGGTVGTPDGARIVVATIPVSVGFSTVERAIGEALGAASDIEWFYGNVYDEQDRPLNWWATEPPA
jgi:hypothetical protein